PLRFQRPETVKQALAASQLDGVALAVVESQRLDAGEPAQRPGEAGCGILPAREQHQSGPGLRFLIHGRPLAQQALSTAGPSRGKIAAQRWDRPTSCGITPCSRGVPMPPSRDIQGLLDIMAALRTPGSGCPWDLEQNFATIAPYTIEEAYEVAEAITRNDLPDLCDELGDLLLQVVFHARMAEEQGAFAFGDVVEAITRKMIRRHPHVFADSSGRLTPADVKGAWDRIKGEEKAERAARRPSEEMVRKSLLSGLKAGQPALTRAMELQRKASSVGFDWNDPRAVLHKIREEADEIEAALDNNNADELADETGDLLFALVNLARHVGADPEMALRGTNAKFERRFAYIERALAAKGRSLEDATLE